MPWLYLYRLCIWYEIICNVLFPDNLSQYWLNTTGRRPNHNEYDVEIGNRGLGTRSETLHFWKIIEWVNLAQAHNNADTNPEGPFDMVLTLPYGLWRLLQGRQRVFHAKRETVFGGIHTIDWHLDETFTFSRVKTSTKGILETQKESPC